MATPEKSLQVFTSRLGSKRSAGDAETRACSVLSCFLAHETSQCTIPTLGLDFASPDVDCCIEQLSARVEARKGNMGYVPGMLLQNVCQTFDKMIVDHLRTALGLMVLGNWNAHNKFDFYKNIQMATLLSSSKVFPTIFTSAESVFKVLPVGKGHIKKIGKTKAVILPLVFKAIIDIRIMGRKNISVTLTAPGTTVGVFSSNNPRIQSVDVTVDAKSLYNCCRAKCDEVILECLEAANEMTQSEQAMPPPSRLPRAKMSSSRANTSSSVETVVQQESVARTA